MQKYHALKLSYKSLTSIYIIYNKNKDNDLNF
jgi:hypothetical protein